MAASRKLLLAIQLQTAQAVKEMERMKGQMKALADHTGHMGKSVFNAQVMFHLFQKGIKAAGDLFRGAMDEFKRAQGVMAQTNAVIKSTGGAAGMTAAEIKKLAGSLQSVTTYEDEAVQEAENMLLTFTKVGKDVFPRATEAILDMTTAMQKTDTKPQAIMIGKLLQSADAMGAAKKIGISFTDEQIKLGKQLQNSGRMAEYQAMVLKELEKEFGGSARAARQTFGGALQALNNSFGDFKENIGGMLSVLAKPVVEFFTKMIDGINEFLQSKEGVEQMSNILGTLAGVFSVLFDVGKQIVDMVFKTLGTIIQPVIDLFNELLPAGKENNIVFDIMAQVLHGLEVVLTVVAKTTAIGIKSIINFGKACYETGALVASFLEMMDKKSIASVRAFEAQQKKTGDAWKKIGTDFIDGIDDLAKYAYKTYTTWNTQVKDNADKMAGIYKKSFTEVKENYRDMMMAMQEGTEGPAAVPGGEDPETAAEKFAAAWKKAIGEVKDAFDTWGGLASDIVGRISDISSMYYDNQLTELENDYAARRRWIEANVHDETERTRQLEALDEEQAAREAEIKKEAFIANKNASIIDSIIKTAQAVVNTLSSIPFPWNIPASVAVGALGVAQTALIASQPVPEFAQGGSFLTQGRQQFVAGDNPGGVERVTVTPVSSAGANAPAAIRQPFIIQIGLRPIYEGIFQASLDGDVRISGRAVVG